MYINYAIIAAVVIVFLFVIIIGWTKSRGINETMGKYMSSYVVIINNKYAKCRLEIVQA